jgi:hypothetical protein
LTGRPRSGRGQPHSGQGAGQGAGLGDGPGDGLGDGSVPGVGSVGEGAEPSGDVAEGDGLGLGLAARVGAGFGIAAGRHDETPLPDARGAAGSGAARATAGSVPGGGKSCAARARIPATSGSWIEPRMSKPGRTSG